jgi:hypothetical protein
VVLPVSDAAYAPAGSMPSADRAPPYLDRATRQPDRRTLPVGPIVRNTRFLFDAPAAQQRRRWGRYGIGDRVGSGGGDGSGVGTDAGDGSGVGDTDGVELGDGSGLAGETGVGLGIAIFRSAVPMTSGL